MQPLARGPTRPTGPGSRGSPPDPFDRTRDKVQNCPTQGNERQIMEDDRAFLERRLHEELALARAQADEGLRSLHRRWAGLYRERLHTVEVRHPVPYKPLPRARPGQREAAR